MPYYDKELLSEAAGRLGFSKEIFLKADEKKPSLLRSFLAFSYGSTSDSFSNYALTDDNLYRAQSNVIKSIGDKGSCIIVGRTADYIMRNHPGLLSIFVHAPEEHRADIVMKRGEAKSLGEALDNVRKVDKSRESYYNYYTNRNWGKADNYDMTFDSSVISTDEIVNFIIAHLNSRPKNLETV